MVSAKKNSTHYVQMRLCCVALRLPMSLHTIFLLIMPKEKIVSEQTVGVLYYANIPNLFHRSFTSSQLHSRRELAHL